MKFKNLVLIAIVCYGLTSCLQDAPEPFDAFEQLAKDQERITNYLSENGITAQKDSLYGVRFVMHTEGTGDKPKVTDRINVDYEGRFMTNGKVFDSNDSIEFPLNQLVSGWQIVLPYVKEGGSVTMYIPSGYGYGHLGGGSIPADANLIFDVTLNYIK
ncbi:MAG: FKBP-type peptidyl-prolyl cis-trans isomerase [Marinoscillum sp.]